MTLPAATEVSCYTEGFVSGECARPNAMLLDLREMSGGRAHVERTYAASDFTVGREEYVVQGDVTLTLDIEPGQDRDQYHVIGRLVTSVTVSCSRCLETLSDPIETAFDLLYLPHAQNTGVGETEIEDDDLTTAFYRDDHIDLGQLIREQVYLSLPMKPLCADACLGLCPACGTNLNHGACRCAATWEEPRWAGLKVVLGRDGTEPSGE